MDTPRLEDAAPAVLNEETQDSLQNLDLLSDCKIVLAYNNHNVVDPKVEFLVILVDIEDG
jgi:hypothetical protein